MLDNDRKSNHHEAEEIAKRIRSSKEEEEEKAFFETYAHYGDESNGRDVSVQNNPSTEGAKWGVKGLVLSLFGVATVGVIGYFGFNHFQTEESKNVVVATAPKVENSINVEQPKETLIKNVEETPPVIEKTVVPAVPKADEPVVPKVVPIVEVEEPKKVEIKKEEVKEEKIVQEEPKKVEPEKVVAKKEEPKKAEPKKVEPKKVVVKKAEPKKVVAKKVVIKNTKQTIITVKKGDTLASIATKYYGDHLEYKRIIRANRSIKNAKSSLSIGQKIIIPAMGKSTTTNTKKKSTPLRTYTVKSGNTLASISKKFYGSTDQIQKIVKANASIKTTKSTLRIGQKINIPQ